MTLFELLGLLVVLAFFFIVGAQSTRDWKTGAIVSIIVLVLMIIVDAGVEIGQMMDNLFTWLDSIVLW